MKHEQLKFTKGFRVSVGNKKSQGAVMVLVSSQSLFDGRTQAAFDGRGLC